MGRFAFVLVGVLAVLLLALRSPAVPLIDPDEPRFARTSVEMLRGNRLVVPEFEGQPRLVKPPLLHWVQMPLFRLFGANEWTARLPSLAATLLTLLILGGLVRRRFGEEGAAWAGLIFVTMPLVVAAGRLGTLDALLALHVFAAIALDMAEPEETGRYRAAAIGGLLGLAFLVKGPVGVILPLIVMLAGRSATGRRVVPTARATGLFLFAMLAILLPWGVAFLIETGPAEAWRLVRGEVFERYFAGTDHVKPPWFYVPVLLIGMLPWFAPLVMALIKVFGRRNDPAARTALYAAAGLLAGLFFFSLGRGKLPTYLLPLAPLAAILVTWELGRELEHRRSRTAGPTLLAASLGIFGLTLLDLSGRGFDAPVPQVALFGATIYLVGALVSLYGLLSRSPRFVFGASATAAAAFMLLATTVLLPGMMRARSSRELIREVPQLDGERPVVVVEMQLPSLTFYLNRVPEKIPAADVGRRLARDDGALFVVDPIDLPLIPAETLFRLREVGRQGKYRVYE